MGGKSLMKKILFINTLFLSLVYSASLSSEEIINMVSKVKEERSGISIEKLNGTANPFILKVKKRTPVKKEGEKQVAAPRVEVVYTLDAILNHAAFINKKWYKKGDKLGEYKVGYISKDSVTLLSSGGNKTLTIKNKNKKFKLNKGYKKW